MFLERKMSIYKLFSILMLVFLLGDFNGSIIEAANVKSKSNPLVLVSKGKAKRILKFKKEAFQQIDQFSEELIRTARQIWEFAEIAMEEYKSSKLLAQLLKDNGFNVEFGAGGLPVAFVATYGQGRPVIGILGEFDALPGLSQKADSVTQEPITRGEPGHGCGHNLFGTASAGAAIAIKTIMQQHKLKGTIKFFGCPAEETVEGKTYMARDGVFSGLDVCLDWHPSSKNQVSLKTSNALNSFEVIFFGKTSHAAGDPWNGRSALDAVELMNHGVNCLREHVPPTVRIHYVIPEAGKAPNVVPDYAKVWYYVRGKDRQEVEEVYARVLKITEGAVLMTETSHRIHVITGVYNYLKNKVVATVLHHNLQLVGLPSFTPEEQEFARQLQRNFGKKEEGMSTVIEPFSEPKEYIGGGSTDAADVSWLVPTASFNVACWPLHTPGHSWGVVSCSGSPVGFKGMVTAAKVFSGAAIDFLLNPKLIQEAQKEFKEKTKDFVYKCAIPENQKPRIGDKR
ncbi:MAG: amidohydrolase [Candidatus Aminicenantes bacterium]|nr:amidohydrolase [Candidatus Aminicenantes bacterium]NIM77427.1 amidohydrolase [Candidatus Aminicenantes bacterium]NIN16733.1 amidohydrolase [Candidatus Aminicenantes bacterium]NIN40589.1 amidohydrolase [Candidatus Aminicenantes bacterium]NIN83410.1 amidohydrolase [Candidatus Aminicenantes bacterium]